MRRISDPGFEYRPWSPERRAKLTAIHRLRYAPPGFRSVYGVHVPERWHDLIVHIARRLRNHRTPKCRTATLEETRAVVQALVDFLPNYRRTEE